MPAEVDSGRHGREDRREAQQLGGHEGEVPRHERDRDLRRWVVESSANLAHDPAHGEADCHSADDAEDELPAGRSGGEGAGDHRGHGDAVEDEPRPVVHEALALHDRDELAGHSEPAGDRGRSERIGRRDDRAEHERGRPGQPLDEFVRDDGHPDRRDDDEADREEPDRPCIGPEVAEGGEERGPVEERREHDEEDELRVELQVRHPRNDADCQAAEDEEDGVGNPKHRGEGEERSHRGQEHESDDPVLRVQVHSGIVPHAAAIVLARVADAREARGSAGL